MKINKTKSIADLTGKDWETLPSSSNFRLGERHEVRRKKLKELRLSEIEFLLELDYADDSSYLVPFGLNKIGNSHTINNFEGLSLLKQIISIRSFNWNKSVEDILKTRAVCKKWMNYLDDELSVAESMRDKFEFYTKCYEIILLQNSLLENLVDWERMIGETAPATCPQD